MLYSFFLMELVARKFFMYFETGFFWTDASRILRLCLQCLFL
jgi:hypothetical protein